LLQSFHHQEIGRPETHNCCCKTPGPVSKIANDSK
jgi:hypothetical protein